MVLPQVVYPNNRRWKRYKVDVPVRVIVGKPTKIVQGRGSELNCGGMTVFAGIELSTDDLVGVEFTPPYSGQPIRVRCAVRNRNGYTYGVEFVAENDADQENVSKIESILQSMGSPVG